MKEDWTTYDKDGHVVSELPKVIVQKNGKRKINPFYKEALEQCPQEIKDRVERMMACAYLVNSDECSKGLPGTPCEVGGCLAWTKLKGGEK